MKKFVIFANDLQKLIPNNKDHEEWALILSEILHANKITDRLEVISFLAQCAHESNQFRSLEENLNYSKTALQRVFKKYFSADELTEFANKPEKIANRVYANRLGNGSEETGDGWKFRGRGIIQLSGKNNILQFGKSVDKNVDEVLEFLSTKKGALLGAVWFWKENGLQKYVNNFETLTKKINGGLNGYDDRLKYLQTADEIFPETFWIDVDEPDITEDIMNVNINVVSIFTEKPELRLFSNNENVKELNNILRNLGFDVNQTSLFDKKTFNAIREIQKHDNKLMTGIVDKETWNTIEVYKNGNK